MPAISSSSAAQPTSSGTVPERLLAAALELVRTEGLRGLSQARVAAAAGLRQSHLTYYFPTRRALIKALIERIHNDMVGSIEPLLAERVAPHGSLDREGLHSLREFMCSCVGEPLMARLMLALSNLTDDDPALREWLAQHDQEMYARLRSGFHRLGVVPPECELKLFHASFIGMVVLSAQSDDAAVVKQFEQLAGLAFDRLVATAPSQPHSG